MADNEMTEHISTSQVVRFCAKALEGAELTAVTRHVVNCPDCDRQIVATLRRQRGTTPFSFTLAPEFWFRHQHIDYEQLVEFAGDKLDAADREMIALHLKICSTCREDVASFLAFREQIAPEMAVSYAPAGRELTLRPSWEAWWRGLAWKPIHVAAVALIGIALVLGVALFLKRKADNLEATRIPNTNVNPGSPGQTPTPDNRASNGPSPPATPSESPVNQNSSAAAIALNDRAGIVTVDKGGKVSGLDDVPTPARDEIARALMTERIERPSILKDLAGEKSALRGNNTEQSFKLITPARTVIVSDRPNFKWEKVSGASTYRVYINDPTGQEAAKSEELSPERTEWTVPNALKRGEVFAWTVVAVVNGKEIVSPGPATPEIKFQILSADNLQELNDLKKTRSHLTLGVFYARVGLLVEAEHQFRQLLRLNPRSRLARSLLHSVRLEE